MLTINWKFYVAILVISVILTRDLILDIPGDIFFSEERQGSKMVILLNGCAHSVVLVGLLLSIDYFDILRLV